MTLYLLIGIVVVTVAIAALTGVKPSSARSIKNTRLMTAGNLVLVVAILITTALALTNNL